MEDFPFEFERKFLVRRLPEGVVEHGAPKVIIQAYVFAEAGYAIRVRLAFRGVDLDADLGTPAFDPAVDELGAYERRLLAELVARSSAPATSTSTPSAGTSADAGGPAPGIPAAPISPTTPSPHPTPPPVATIAVKSPSVAGERYEMETELDPEVAVQIIQRSGRIVAKTRHSLWVGEDGWEFDVFSGQNAGLVVAEIERLSPVVDLAIPDFCVTEVTTDPRFTNDSLAKEPWQHWDALYMNELAQRGPFFLDLRG
ncbi:adenylate cyclase [Trueperella bernardiae]|uniref:adenylate cyclase n=1 Tax=Trueperella bernardiae TaxID=59561 RepID=UPI0020437707|nr:adenylate cyclase [Trueperella bernardiae]MCM3906904.1 adenylate cyclase [Trueperella bernardiae]